MKTSTLIGLAAIGGAIFLATRKKSSTAAAEPAAEPVLIETSSPSITSRGDIIPGADAKLLDEGSGSDIATSDITADTPIPVPSLAPAPVPPVPAAEATIKTAITNAVQESNEALKEALAALLVAQKMLATLIMLAKESPSARAAAAVATVTKAVLATKEAVNQIRRHKMQAVAHATQAVSKAHIRSRAGHATAARISSATSRRTARNATVAAAIALRTAVRAGARAGVSVSRPSAGAGVSSSLQNRLGAFGRVGDYTTVGEHYCQD